MLARDHAPELHDAAVLPVVDRGDRDAERLRRVLVALALAHDQADRVLLVLPKETEGGLQDVRRDLGLLRSAPRARGVGVEGIVGLRPLLQQFAQPRRARVPAPEQVVRDLEEVADRDRQPLEIRVLKQPEEDLLRQVLGHIGRRRLA